MLILDRVLCNCCGDDMGQLYNQPAPQPDALEDHTSAPHFAVCPNCDADSEKEAA